MGGAKEGPMGGAADEETGGGLWEQGTMVPAGGMEPALVCLGLMDGTEGPVDGGTEGPVDGGTEGPVEGGTEGPVDGGTTDDSTEERRSEAWRLPSWDASSKELERFRLAEGRGGELAEGFAGGDEDMG